MSDWKHFSQVIHLKKKRSIIGKILDFFFGKRYIIETVEINFMYNGDVEPDVILGGLYIEEIKKEVKKIS